MKKKRERPSGLDTGNQNTIPEVGVYFLASSDGRRVKIGKSQNIRTRIADIARMTPHGATLVATVPDGYTYTEAWFHDVLDDCRAHGEWFDFNERVHGLIALVHAGTYPEGLRAALRSDNVVAEPEKYRRPPPVRRFKSATSVLDCWERAGGPLFRDSRVVTWSDIREQNPYLLHTDPLVIGVWVRRGTLRLHHGSYAFPPRFAHGLAHLRPEDRAAEILYYAVMEYEHYDGVKFFDAKTLGVIHSARVSPLMSANARHYLPDAGPCEVKRCECSTWIGNARDEVEQLERVAHHAAAWALEWDLVLIDHERGDCSDCYRCKEQP